MSDWSFIIEIASLLVGAAAGLTFINASRAFTPGLLRNIVWSGALVVGFLAIGELLNYVADSLGGPLQVLSGGGDVLMIIGTLLFALAMYRASLLGQFFGFRTSTYFRSRREGDEA